MATPSVDRVRSAIRSLQSQSRDLLHDFDGTVLYAKLVAEDLERDSDSASVQELQDATLDILACSNDLRNHSKALDSIGASYEPSSEATNFKVLLKDYVKELEEESPFNPENHDFFKQFKEAVWKVHHAGELMPGQEQEDFVVMGASQMLPNTSCPLSGKPIDKLENPVRSNCRHIYEREAVFAFIRRHQIEVRRRKEPCKCAAAGCRGNLVEEELVCDGSLKIEIQEYMLRQRSSNVDTVADCTYLDEDDETTPSKSFASRGF